MDIFKLFFNHDQRLDKPARQNANKTPKEVEATLADFLKPDPTFSKFYLSGTRLPKEKFGINQLHKYDQILEKLDTIFDNDAIYSIPESFTTLSEALNSTSMGSVILISNEKDPAVDINSLNVDNESNAGYFKDELRTVLMGGHKVIYKEQAKNGFDLHLFSRENIYPKIFHPLQSLVDDSFRFFSINSKRMRTEKHVYFETWALDNPPHGAEEVFPETVL